MRRLKTQITWLALGMTALLGASLSEAGQDSRQIYINGERLDARGIALVDQLSCGARVPNGRYWLNMTTGAWGYDKGWLEIAKRRNHGATAATLKIGFLSNRA
jgi:hypothetical protein